MPFSRKQVYWISEDLHCRQQHCLFLTQSLSALDGWIVLYFVKLKDLETGNFLKPIARYFLYAFILVKLNWHSLYVCFSNKHANNPLTRAKNDNLTLFQIASGTYLKQHVQTLDFKYMFGNVIWLYKFSTT